MYVYASMCLYPKQIYSYSTLTVEETSGRGRPKKRWNEVMKHNLETSDLIEAMTIDQDLQWYTVLDKIR